MVGAHAPTPRPARGGARDLHQGARHRCRSDGYGESECVALLALRTELLERSRKTFPNGHVNIAKYAWDLGETLAAQEDDVAYSRFCAEWLPQWRQLFGEQDGRVVDAQTWLGEAEQRLARAP